MNVTSNMQTQFLNPEIETLHDILCDCGINQLWSNPKLRVLKFYLQNCDADEHMRECLGPGIFWNLVKPAKPKSSPLETNIVHDVLFWLLKNADGYELKQALRKSAMQMSPCTVLQANFDRSHPNFARDHAEFEKLVTLMVIEGFPADFGLVREHAVQRLTCYELLHLRHGDTPILRKLRKSINRSEARVLAIQKTYHLGKKATLKGKTTCAKKFLALSYWDRIRLMRYYRFVVAETK